MGYCFCREDLGEGFALGFSQWGEQRVGHRVVFCAEVVETLGVADEVECYGHFDVWLRELVFSFLG